MSATLVYFVGCPKEGIYKLGMTTNFRQRFRILHAHNPFHLEVLATTERMAESEAIALEAKYHKMLTPFRTKGEWYRMSEEDVKIIVNKLRPPMALPECGLTEQGPMLTLKQAAEHLGIEETVVSNLLLERKLPGLKVGYSWRLNPQDLELWQKQHRNGFYQ